MTENKKNSIKLCACMGPINGDPYCPCKMIEAGLTPSSTWTPEKIKELSDVIAKCFGNKQTNK